MFNMDLNIYYGFVLEFMDKINWHISINLENLAKLL